MYRRLLLVALTVGAAIGIAASAGSAGAGQPFALTSTAFNNNSPIPSAYTCDGPNNRPPLIWSGVPGDTESFAILVDDVTLIRLPGPPPEPFILHFTHWITWNIDGGATSVDPGKSHRIFGTNDFGTYHHPDYAGPCAPTGGPFSGLHTYVFTLYALTSSLDLKVGATRREFDDAIDAARDAGNVVGTAELIGTYCRGCP
jgi:Raf kinase inhibitor-like YbhB/YbcL family protein